MRYEIYENGISCEIEVEEQELIDFVAWIMSEAEGIKLEDAKKAVYFTYCEISSDAIEKYADEADGFNEFLCERHHDELVEYGE